MKGIAYIVVLAFFMLGIFGLLYVVFDEVMDTNIYPWGQANIIDGNQTTWQTYYRLGWEALPVIAVFGLFMFLIVWSQKGEAEYAYQ